MNGPLAGINVVEVANYLVVPSAAALMADMGAKVIKVVPHEGDPWRNMLRSKEFEFDFPTNYAFQLDNLGKRGKALDLRIEEATEVVWKLAERADVFVTNLVPRRLERFRLRYEDLSPVNPRLVYLAFSGYGSLGHEKDRLVFDHTAFWTRSGIMSLFSELSPEPIDLLAGQGDHTTCPLLLAGVLAALFERERSGKGQKVTASLLNMGLWVIGADVQDALVARRAPHRFHRSEAPDPLYNTYRTKDGRWLLMVMPNMDANWSGLCRAVGRADLSSNPRYGAVVGRMEHSMEIISELDGAIGSMTLEELAPLLDANSVIWAPMQDLLQAIDDPQARANGFFTTLQHPQFGPFETLNTPIQFE